MEELVLKGGKTNSSNAECVPNQCTSLTLRGELQLDRRKRSGPGWEQEGGRGAVAVDAHHTLWADNLVVLSRVN